MSRQRPHTHPALITVIIVFVLLIVSLIKNAIGLYQSRNRLETIQSTVIKLESDKQLLEEKLNTQSDPESIDQIIRNKLNVAQPGDIVVMITGSESSHSTPSALPTPSPTPNPPYLQWWHLFTKQ